MGISAEDKKLLEEIEDDLVYHKPDAEKAARHEQISSAARDFARVVIENCPASRERSVTITKLQEARMWANAAIALN